MRHLQTCRSPALPGPEIPAAKKARAADPPEQQEGMTPAACTGAQDHWRYQQFDARHQSEQSAAQGEGFHDVRLDNTPQELTGPLLACLLEIKP
jgi:hypothetical protein